MPINNKILQKLLGSDRKHLGSDTNKKSGPSNSKSGKKDELSELSTREQVNYDSRSEHT